MQHSTPVRVNATSVAVSLKNYKFQKNKKISKKGLQLCCQYSILNKRVTERTTKWLVGQAVKTLPSHGRISGSIPLRAAKNSKANALEFFFCKIAVHYNWGLIVFSFLFISYAS